MLLAKPGKDDEFAVCMSRLADDITLRADLSRRAFGEVATQYDWSKIVDRLCEVYEHAGSKML